MKQNKMRSLDHPSPMLVPLPTVAPLAQPWSVPSHSFTPPSKAWRPRHAPEKKGGDMEQQGPDAAEIRPAAEPLGARKGKACRLGEGQEGGGSSRTPYRTHQRLGASSTDIWRPWHMHDSPTSVTVPRRTRSRKVHACHWAVKRGGCEHPRHLQGAVGVVAAEAVTVACRCQQRMCRMPAAVALHEDAGYVLTLSDLHCT
jgi:hypothetical protein